MDPINLNKARKARARDQARAEAAANRSRFGRTKAEKAADRLETEKANRTVEGARLQPPKDRP